MSGLFSEADLSVDTSLNGATTGPFSVFNAASTALVPSASTAAAAAAADPTAALFDALSSSLAASPYASEHFPSALAIAADSVTGGCALNELQRQEVIRGLNALWRERAQALRDNQTAQEELSILRSKLDDATDRCATLKVEKAKAERQSWEVEERRRLEHAEGVKAEKALRKAMTEMEKANNMLRGCETQYKHQLRKGEMAFTTIQEKLHKIILEKTSSIPTTSSLGSTHASKASGAASAAAAAAAAANGSWQMSAPIKSIVARKTAANDLPSSSADVELLQSTMATYSERITDLVGENIALKAALKNLAGELEAALKEHAAGATAAAAAEDQPASGIEDEYASSTVEVDEHGVPLPRAPGAASGARCISPSTAQLLAEFTPAQIELPWDLVGQSIQKVLSAKLAQLRAGVAASRQVALASQDAEFESSLVAALKSKVAEQAAIIAGQDGLIQQVLAAPMAEECLAREAQELRRLSIKAEVQDWNARKQNIVASAAQQLQSQQQHRGSAIVPPSPTSARILGPHTAANLPVFPTPAKPAFASLAGVLIPLPPLSSNPKSKWLAGGVLASPVFTPSKRSMQRAGGAENEETNLSELDEEEIEAAQLDFDNDDDDEIELATTEQEETPAAEEEAPVVVAPVPMSLQAAAAARIK